MKRSLYFRALMALFLLPYASQQANTLNFIFQAPGRNWAEEVEFDTKLAANDLAKDIVDNLADIGETEGYEDVSTITLSCDFGVTRELAGKIRQALQQEQGLRGWTFQTQFNQENTCLCASFHRQAEEKSTLHDPFDLGEGEGCSATNNSAGEEEEEDSFSMHEEEEAEEEVEDSSDEEEVEEAVVPHPHIAQGHTQLLEAAHRSQSLVTIYR